MARFYPSGGAGGGVTSDDVTTTPWDVVAGKKTVMSNSDDEVADGTLPDQTTDVGPTNSFRYQTGYCVDFPSGAYRRGDVGNNGGGRVIVPQSKVATDIALNAQKLANGEQVLGITGTYKGLGTAGQADVRTGKTFSTSSLSNAAGTMPERGAVSYSLPVNGTYTVPNGYHNGSGKVTQSLPVQGGSTTLPGTANKTIVAANRYVNGNIVVSGDPNLTAANIKKNVTIFGVRGTAEGFPISAQDLYAYGTTYAISDSSAAISFEKTYIKISPTNESNSQNLSVNKTLDVSQYSSLKMQGVFFRASDSYAQQVGMQMRLHNNGNNISYTDIKEESYEGVITFNISNITNLSSASIWFSRLSITKDTRIDRIWLA